MSGLYLQPLNFVRSGPDPGAALAVKMPTARLRMPGAGVPGALHGRICVWGF